MNSQEISFTPIIDDVESSRRFTASSVVSTTQSCRGLAVMSCEEYLLLPRMTSVWQQHCHAYHQATESSSSCCILPRCSSSAPLPGDAPTSIPVPEENSLSGSRLSKMKEVEEANRFSSISHECDVRLWKTAAEVGKQRENLFLEERIMLGKKSPRILQERKEESGRKGNNSHDGADDKGSNANSVSTPSTTFKREETATSSLIPPSSPHSSSFLFHFTPHVQKEWWASSLSLSFLPQHYRSGDFLLPSPLPLPSETATIEAEKGEQVATSSFSPTAERMPGKRSSSSRVVHRLTSQLSPEQRRERMEWYLYQRFFPFLGTPHHSNDREHTRGTVIPCFTEVPHSTFSSNQTVTFWEDRRRGLDDFTLSIAPLPFSCLRREEQGGPSHGSVTPTEVGGGRGMKKGSLRAHLFYSEDVLRMDPFAFRSRVCTLWDLAEAISTPSTCSSSTSSSRKDMNSCASKKINLFKGKDQASPLSTSFSSFRQKVSEMNLSPSARDVAILVSYLGLINSSSSVTPSASSSPRCETCITVEEATRLQVAGMLRCRVLVELCLVRLSGTKLISRCPYQWRTAAHFFFSLAEVVPTSLLLSSSFPIDENENESKEEMDKKESVLEKEYAASTSASILLSQMGAYIHHVLIPYLAMKDRHFWNRGGKEELAGIEKNKREEETISNSATPSVRSSSPFPSVAHGMHLSQNGEHISPLLLTAPAKHFACHFPNGFLNPSLLPFLPPSLQQPLSPLHESVAELNMTKERNYHAESDEEEKNEETLIEKCTKSVPVTEDITLRLLEKEEGKVQKKKIASFLVQLLFLRCGWAGDEIKKNEDEVKRTQTAKEEKMDNRSIIAHHYLKNGIPFAASDKHEIVHHSLEIKKQEFVSKGDKTSTFEAHLFLLRDVLRSSEKRETKNEVQENDSNSSFSSTISHLPCRDTALESSDLFHSSDARRAAFKNFFIKYFLSNPQDAFEGTKQSR